MYWFTRYIGTPSISRNAQRGCTARSNTTSGSKTFSPALRLVQSTNSRSERPPPRLKPTSSQARGKLRRGSRPLHRQYADALLCGKCRRLRVRRRNRRHSRSRRESCRLRQRKFWRGKRQHQRGVRPFAVPRSGDDGNRDGSGRQ